MKKWGCICFCFLIFNCNDDYNMNMIIPIIFLVFSPVDYMFNTEPFF